MRGLLALTLIALSCVSSPADAKRRGVQPNRGRSKGGRHARRTVPLPVRPPLQARNNGGAESSFVAPFVNIWSQLSDAEAAQTVAFMHAQSELNLTATENATSWSNSIVVVRRHPSPVLTRQVETLLPNKTLALDFLSSKTGVPQRYARVSIIFGATNDTNAYLREYSVGPLNGGTVYYKELNWQTTKGTTKQPVRSASKAFTHLADLRSRRHALRVDGQHLQHRRRPHA